jgi:hypothetical protein
MAGLAHATIHSRLLIVDTYGLKELSHGKGSSINHFNLPGKFIKSRNVSFLAKCWRRLAFSKPLSRFNLGVFVAPNLGYRPEIDTDSKRFFFIEGFFHTYKYYNFLQSDLVLSGLELKKSSNWLIDKLDVISKKRVCAAHLRLGDFEANWEHFGILSVDYYRKEFTRLMDLDIEEIWIFSNDIAKAKELFAEFSLIDLKFIDPPKEASDAESLVLLSNAKYIITGNSTFSWWAALISKPSAIVVAPEPFFRSEKPIDYFYPLGWSLATSIWQDY